MVSRRPNWIVGAVVGLCTIAPLVVIFAVAAQVAGTPFVPFDMFDLAGRVLPGPVITFGIDMIVNTIAIFQLGETSSAAKTAEQFLAIVGMVVTGIGASALLFWSLQRYHELRGLIGGLVMGLVVGAPVMLISTAINLSATQPKLVSAIWIMLGFAVWGLVVGWLHERFAMESSTEPAAAASDSSASVKLMDRRTFVVQMGAASAVLTVVGAGLARLLTPTTTTSTATAISSGDGTLQNVAWSANNALPNVGDALAPAPGTRPEFTPLAQHYRIDINTLPPVIEEAEWRLNVSGLVETPIEMTLADIQALEPMHQFVTLACISNRIAGDLIGTTRWTGVSLRTLVEQWNPLPTATHLKITSADNFDEFLALDTVMADERVMLSYAWDGLPLEAKHGFPLRIYIPDHYGMKQPKWITTIEFVDAWGEGFWVRRGWDKDAFMRSTSVIDTVAVNDAVEQDSGSRLIPIGGIAHAGDRGISAVEVRVNGGEWMPAQLRQPLSEVTWVIWRYDWPFEAGQQRFEVRCVEGDGTAQIEDPAGSRPSGATGIHSVSQGII
jgi:DMSO/TMAO reductase YedYZ molybdopterin-dependent catalytic subunit